MTDDFRDCTLCPRKCGINRYEKTGFCGMGAEAIVNIAMIHHGEEPPISGFDTEDDSHGSGTVFFEGCTLKCPFCQNRAISQGPTGKGQVCDVDALTEIYLSLKWQGAYNINLVTASHFAPVVAASIAKAKERGLNIPFVYNCGGYESVETLKLFDGLIDIYMPDFKFWDEKLSGEIIKAPDYREVAIAAIDEMFAQTGPAVMDKDTGLMKKGLIVRHLMMPGQLFDTKKILDHLTERYGNDIYISLMNQYTPMPHLDFAPAPRKDILLRTVPLGHYDSAVDHLVDRDQYNAFVQDSTSQGDTMIPPFRI
ncbi:MAG: radical SAM protein [Lachnospiraceae bacterium]|nr:radical SAM protein [Lachnospiraceae bacterium]